MEARLFAEKPSLSRIPGHLYITKFIVSVLLISSLIPAVLAAGCAGEQIGTPGEIMKKAISAQGKLKSVRLRMDTEMELKSPGETRDVSLSYKGFFERPDKWSLVMQSGGMKSEVVIIGTDTYVKAPGSDVWEKRRVNVLGDSSSENVVDLDYLKAASDVRLVDRKGETYHMEFKLDVAANAALFDVSGISEYDRSLVKGKKAQMEIWIQKETYYIEEARLSFTSNSSGGELGGVKVYIETSFSDFNEPVSIEAPI